MKASRRAATTAALVLAVSLGVSMAATAGVVSKDKTTGSQVIVAEFGGAYSKSINDTLVAPFSKSSGYSGRVVDTVDRVQKPLAMIKAQNVEWDIVEVLDNEYSQLLSSKAIQKLPPALYKQLKRTLSPGTVTPYGVAISAYSYIIACNKSTVTKCPQNAKQFFDTTNYPGHRTVYKDGWLDNMALAAEANGVSPKRLFPLDVTGAANTWRTFKNQIDVFFTTGDQWQQLFRDKEVDMGIGPDGRTWNLVDKEGMNLNISYTGTLLHTDYFVVLKGAPNAKGAFAFLKWYATHPRAEAAFASQQLYGVPNPAAYKFMKPAVARALVGFPANIKQTVPVDLAWVYKNGDAASKVWEQVIGG